MTIKTIKQRFGITPNFRQLIGIGQICLVAAIFLGRLELQVSWADFLEGMLLGISIVTNLAGLYLFGRGKNQNDNRTGHFD